MVETPSTSLTVLSVDPVQTTVFIDEKINNKEVKLVAELSEELIGSDTKIELASNTLGVGGPRTYVDKISYAKIIIDAVKLDESALDNSQKTEYKVFFYDDADNIVQSPYIVFNSSDIEVSFADTNSETSAAQTEAQSEQSAQ